MLDNCVFSLPACLTLCGIRAACLPACLRLPHASDIYYVRMAIDVLYIAWPGRGRAGGI